MTRGLASRRRYGFTLVEMLVALTIGSLLVVSIVSSTRALSGSRASVDHRIERQASARRAMEAITSALRNVRRDPIKTEPVVLGRSGGRDQGNDQIDLLVISDRPCRAGEPESDQYEMSFFLSQREDSPLPMLMCRKDHAFDEFPEDGGLVTVVAEGIVGLSFEYLREQEWLSDWPASEERPPEAVRVTVAAQNFDPARPEQPSEMTVLSTVVAIGVTQAPTEKPRPSGDNQPGGSP